MTQRGIFVFPTVQIAWGTSDQKDRDILADRIRSPQPPFLPAPIHGRNSRRETIHPGFKKPMNPFKQNSILVGTAGRTSGRPQTIRNRLQDE
jgi:hypothetical protein